MQSMIFLFYGLAKMIIIKLICIKSIDNNYKNKLKNIVNLKKTLIICNIKKCFGIIVKLSIIFIAFNGKNEKKCYLI